MTSLAFLKEDNELSLNNQFLSIQSRKPPTRGAGIGPDRLHGYLSKSPSSISIRWSELHFGEPV